MPACLAAANPLGLVLVVLVVLVVPACLLAANPLELVRVGHACPPAANPSGLVRGALPTY